MKVSSEMVEACEQMKQALQAWIRGGRELPQFALPPRHVLLIAPIDQVVGILARNDAARTLVEVFCAIGCSIEHSGEPTVNMLRAVLDRVGVPYETVPIETFGRLQIMRTPGGRPS